MSAAAPSRAEWVCAQQGAREHYSIPRALAAAGRLRRVITDAWVPPGSPWAKLPGALGRRLMGRYHPGLLGQPVTHFTGRFLRADLVQRLRPRGDEAYHTARNDLFDRLAAKALEREPRQARGVVFGYCHASWRLFAAAKARGDRTILGQFDPGPREADIVDHEHAAFPEFRTGWKRYSAEYVDLWREEVAAADALVANSEWSRECLMEAGVPRDKIAVVPLAYPAATVPPFSRDYPSAFTRGRPLRILFLGQVILRKGIARLLRAAAILSGDPVEFRLVGPTDIANLDELSRGLPVRTYGPVPRAEVDRHYREADLFILPTLSDGYALTQLEALAWRLPVVASRYCGTAVRPGIDGVVLDEPTADAIAEALRGFLDDPAALAELSRYATADGYGLDRLAGSLIAVGEGP